MSSLKFIFASVTSFLLDKLSGYKSNDIQAWLYNQSICSVCTVIIKMGDTIGQFFMKEGFLTCPSTEEEQKKLSQVFKNKWDFSHAIGVLDGKHIVMQASLNAESGYLNNTKTHNFVLPITGNASYEFILIDRRDSG